LQENMKKLSLLNFALLIPVATLSAQATHKTIDPLLQQPLQNPALVADQLRHLMLTKVQPLPTIHNAKELQTQAEALRRYELSVLYHGWPDDWVNSSPKFERVGVIERPGYRIVKFRYEIVPGFSSTALLYEPEHITAKMPAILNVNGHGPGGKAVEHKQKRCINQARHGILSLSLEWIGFGELAGAENGHNQIGLLDLAGANGAGLFYLAMRRGLDFLYEDTRVDRQRIGMTGLSGGGWQTMLLSSLDPRIGPSVPVAGFSSLTTAIEHPEYAGDAEQNAPDMRTKADYAQLMAVRAPRPTLLIYNSMDDCCFRAGVVKQGVFTDALPFFSAANQPKNLLWSQNDDPGTHNYQIDSRLHAYRFFKDQFHLQTSAEEDPDTDQEVLPAEELVVGLPKDNLTIVGLARKLAAQIQHPAASNLSATDLQKQHDLLKDVVRFSDVTVTHAWPVSATHERGVESRGYRFEFSNGLTASGVFLQSSASSAKQGLSVLISDTGRTSMSTEAGDLLSRGHRVLVFDPILFGDSIPGTTERPNLSGTAQMLNTVGERALGLEAAQIAAITHWLQSGQFDGTSTSGSASDTTSSSEKIHLITRGPRSEVAALVATALQPQYFSSLRTEKGMKSFADIFTQDLGYSQIPELLCLDLYRDFDIEGIRALAPSVAIDLNAHEPEPIFWR
jgi:hypothetical protein